MGLIMEYTKKNLAFMDVKLSLLIGCGEVRDRFEEHKLWTNIRHGCINQVPHVMASVSANDWSFYSEAIPFKGYDDYSKAIKSLMDRINWFLSIPFDMISSSDVDQIRRESNFDR